MNLQLFLRAIVTILFQPSTKSYSDFIDNLSYDNLYFFTPRIHCKDGFNISIQIHNATYCESENGYRTFGYEWKKAEWGFPSIHEPMLLEDAEDKEDITGTVGSSTIELLQQILDNHGGIDWEQSLSIDNCKKITKQ